jgi:hypothetical protein
MVVSESQKLVQQKDSAEQLGSKSALVEQVLPFIRMREVAKATSCEPGQSAA